ncbi:MAG: DsbA family protein [Pseudomonadota bacterium]
MTDAPRCYFGFRSPFSRLGLHVLRRAGVQPDLHPFRRAANGGPFLNPTDNPAKRAYYRADAVRMTRRMDLPFALPKPFEIDFAPANHVFIHAKAAGVALEFAIAASDARWGEGRDISQPAVLADCLEVAGCDRALADIPADDPAALEGLAAADAAVDADNVFGVPFLVAGGEPFWGHDRFALFVETHANA